MRDSADVAAKLVPIREPSRAASLVDHYQRLAGIVHPNLVPILDVGITGDFVYVVMPIASGGSLRDRSPWPTPVETASFIRQVAAGVQHLHMHDIVHMDVKPSNILLGPGDAPLVTDVGYSTTRGTPAYMSPEQCQLQKPTSASDQYALAVMSYLLLVGRLPFTGDTNKLLRQHVYTAPPPPPVPTEVERVLLTGLAKSPRDRFPSISALAFKLEQAIGGARWDIQHGAPSDDRTLEAITLDSESAPELARRA